MVIACVLAYAGTVPPSPLLSILILAVGVCSDGHQQLMINKVCPTSRSQWSISGGIAMVTASATLVAPPGAGESVLLRATSWLC